MTVQAECVPKSTNHVPVLSLTFDRGCVQPYVTVMTVLILGALALTRLIHQ